MINYFEPSVVVVDDVIDEVSGILNYYSDLGVGCKLFNPDLYDGDNQPETPFSDVNIIYLDLFYSGKFDAERCVSWIRHILKPKSFYILIMWTKDGSKATEVEELLSKHRVTPFLTLIKSKSEYNVDGVYDYDKLFEEVNDQFAKTPSLEEILIWKKSIKYSSNQIIGHITKTPHNITQKLKKIIIAHGGNSVKEGASDSSKRNTLFDALDTVLISNTKQNIEGKISKLNSDVLYDLSTENNTSSDKELNTWFHFKLQSNIEKGLLVPGLLCAFKEGDWKDMYAIDDDENVSNYISNQNGDNVTISNIVLLLSRPCDLAQKKYGKNLKLLSGVKIINPVRKDNPRQDFKGRGNKFDSIKLFDHLYFSEDEKDVTILFDFRYSFSVPEEIFINDFENIRIFNKELLSEVQVEYSSYSSRLGITQII